MTTQRSGAVAACCLALSAIFSQASAQPHDHSPPPNAYHCTYNGRTVPILPTANIASAQAVFVGNQPRIYVSPVFADDVGPVMAKFVGAHECAHIRNRDTLPFGQTADLTRLSVYERELRADRDALADMVRRYHYRDAEVAEINAKMEKFVEEGGDHPANGIRAANLLSHYARLSGRILALN